MGRGQIPLTSPHPLLAPPHRMQGAGQEAGRPPAPPASRQRAEVTHAQSHFRRAETRKKLGAAEALLPRVSTALVPRGPAAQSCREPWPWGSPGPPQCEARGLPRAPRQAEGGQAGGVVPAAVAAARPGSRHHEYRRGVPHPAQLPLEQVAGQRETGTAGTRGPGPALPSPACGARGVGAAPRRRIPPFPRRGLGEIDPLVKG